MTSLNGLTGGETDGGIGGTGSSGGIASSSSGGGSSGGSSSGGGPSLEDGSTREANDGGSGGTSTDDGGAGDGSNPAPKTDASSSVDAGIKDAGADTAAHDAAPSPFCASLSPAPLFCDDFDDGGVIGAPWDQLASTSGSELLTASTESPPDALLVTVVPNASVSSIDVAGYKSLTAKQGVAGTATTSFDIKVTAADESSSSDAILGAIQLWNGTAYWDLELEVFYSSASGDFTVSMSEDGTSYVQHASSTHLPLGTWTRVTLSIVLPAGSGGATTATMAFNGTTVASDTVHVSTSDPIPEILIGTTYATPTSGGWTVAYDNVTFDEK